MEISLGNFTTYYGLMIGFSVTYTTVEIIAKYFNEATYKKYEEDKASIEKHSELAKRLLIVYQDSKSLYNIRLREEFKIFETQVEKLKTQNFYVEQIGSGLVFKPFFKLTGAFFLYMVLLTCFAGVIHNELVTLMGFNLAFIYLLFFISKFIMLKNECIQKFDITKNDQHTPKQEPEKTKFFSFLKNVVSKTSVIGFSTILFYGISKFLSNKINCLIYNIIICIVLYILLLLWDYFHDSDLKSIIKKPIKHEYLRTFIALGLIVTIYSSIIYYCFNMHSYFDCKEVICRFIDVSELEFMKAIAMFFVVNFATVPFFVYFFRDYIFIEQIHRDMDFIKNETDNKANVYSSYFKQNPIIKT